MSLSFLKPSRDALKAESNPFHLAASEGALATLAALVTTDLARSFPLTGLGVEGRSVLGAALPFCHGESGALLIRQLIDAGCDPASVEPLPEEARRLRYQGLQSAFEAAEREPGSQPVAPIGLMALTLDEVAASALWGRLSSAQKMAVAHAGGAGCATRSGRLEIVEELASLGADLNAPDAAGVLPLSMAVEPSAVSTLLRLGADLNARDGQGRSAAEILMGAQSSGRKEKEMAKVAMDWLAEKAACAAKNRPVDTKAPPSITPEQAPLVESAFAALKAKNLAAARYAISALGKAAVLARDAQGDSLLSAAVEARFAPLISSLIRKGGDPFEFDSKGGAPFFGLCSAPNPSPMSSRDPFDRDLAKIAKSILRAPAGVPWTKRSPQGHILAELFFNAPTCLGDFWTDILPSAQEQGWDVTQEDQLGLSFAQRVVLALNTEPAPAVIFQGRGERLIQFLTSLPPQSCSPKGGRAFLDEIGRDEALPRALGAQSDWHNAPSFIIPEFALNRLGQRVRAMALDCAQRADLTNWDPSETLRAQAPDFVAAVETMALKVSAPSLSDRPKNASLRV